MRRVVLDTDVASLIIKDRLPAALLCELVGAQTGITFVTLGELTRWATMRQWAAPRRADLTRWLAARPTLPYTDEIARTWGEISAAARRGRPRPQTTPGSPPAALSTTCPSLPLNVKDFKDFAEHAGLTPHRCLIDSAETRCTRFVGILKAWGNDTAAPRGSIRSNPRQA